MARIDFTSARTSLADPDAAAEALVSALGGGEPKLVTLFAPDGRDHPALNRALRARLPPRARLIGASTGGEIDREGMHRGTVVVGAFSGDLEVGLGLGTGLGRDAIAAGADAMRRATMDLGTTSSGLDRRRNVALVIDDGPRFKKEELLMGALADAPDVSLVGGGASAYELVPFGDRARLHVDGEVAGDAVLVALFATQAPFAALRSHWFLPTGEKLTITRVDASCTRALEIDGQPAARRYAELIGVPVSDLGHGSLVGFEARPTAVRVGREHILRSPWMALPDGSVLFANLVEEGTELELMRIGDAPGITRRFFTDEIPARVSDPTAALFFHCGARTQHLVASGEVAELSATLAHAPPCAGMDVCFEIHNGLNVNSTLTALVFGRGP